jgi:hypothetical protein
MVWYLAPTERGDFYNGNRVELRETSAFGLKPERRSLEEAYADLVALRMTSMKDYQFGGTFSASVVSYPRDGFAPRTITREVYFTIDAVDDDHARAA